MTRRATAETRAIAVASLVLTAGSMPQLMIGPLAPQLRTDVGFSDSDLGLAVSLAAVPALFFGYHGGKVTDHVGGVRAGQLACGLSLAFMLALSQAGTPRALILLMLASGVMRIVTDSASSKLLIADIAAPRRVQAFAIREATVPSVVLLAAAAVPILGSTASWRAVLASAAILPIAGLLLLAHHSPAPVDHGTSPSPQVAITARFLLGVGILFAVASVLNTFAAVTLADRGVGRPGVVVAIAALLTIVMRLVTGAITSRRPGLNPARLIVAFSIGGSIGVFAMALDSSSAAIAGTVLAYGLGWGWTPVLFSLVTVGRDESAGRSTGLIAAMYAASALIAPAVAGRLTDSAGHSVMWSATAAASVAAALFIWQSTGGTQPATPPHGQDMEVQQ